MSAMPIATCAQVQYPTLDPLFGPHTALSYPIQRIMSRTSLPYPVWDVLTMFASIFPSPPLTRAQVTLMKHDNVVAKPALSLEDLGIKATALEEILPKYAF